MDATEDAAAALCLMASLEPEQIVPTIRRNGSSSNDLGSIGQLSSGSTSSATVPLGVGSSQSMSSPPLSSSPQPSGFVARVSSIPVVNSAVNKISNMYESSKASSSILKFGAETVESSVMKLYRPIQTMVEPQLNDINTFGCKQLDKLQEQFPIVMEQPDTIYQKGTQYLSSLLTTPPLNNASDLTGQPSVDGVIFYPSDDLSRKSSSGLRRRIIKGSEESAGGDDGSPSTSDSDADDDGMDDGSQRSRKRRTSTPSTTTVMLSPPAGGMWSESLRGIYGKSYESLQLVRQTVQIMQAVEEHIGRQTSYLIETIQQLQAYLQQQSLAMTGDMMHLRLSWIQALSTTTADVRHDIADALRQVMDAISKSATLLPSFAQQKVKEFILALPARWAMGAHALVGAINPRETESRILTDGQRLIALSKETRSTLQSLIALFTQYLDLATQFIQRLPFAQQQERQHAILSGQQEMGGSSSSPSSSSSNPLALASILNREQSDNQQTAMEQ